MAATIVIKGRGIGVSDKVREYAERKIGKLDHYLSEISEVRVDLSAERTARSADDRQVVQLTVPLRGAILRSEERSGHPHGRRESPRRSRRRRPDDSLTIVLSHDLGGAAVLASYPFLSGFWYLLVFFAWIIWFWLLITVFADIFRRHDIGGGKKTLWVVFVIILPFLGVLIYLIAESKGMADRNMQQAQAAQQQADAYIRDVASSADPAEQIAKAKQLLDAGTISASEFDALKQKALAT